MPRNYQHKFLDDGTPNPKYKPDTRTGDRHKNKADRNIDDRHSGNYQRGSRRKTKFIAIDGEGINITEVVAYYRTKKTGKTIPVYRHRYVLLVASCGCCKPIINKNGISAEESFEWLLNLADKHPDAIFVCFGMSYDVTSILKGLNPYLLERVYGNSKSGFNAPKVYYKGTNGNTYTVAYKPHISFTISRREKTSFIPKIKKSKYGTRYIKYVPSPGPSVTVWEVHGFFNRKFVDVLGDSDIGYFHEYMREENGREIIEWPDGLRIDLTAMKDMKNRRRSFTLDQLGEIIPYCTDEVKALQKLMEHLREILEKADLLPFQSRWYGAGSCANTLLQKHRVKEHMTERFPYIGFRELIEVQKHAYSGGRFELGKFGLYLGKIYNYDRRSSFPSDMLDLPCLTGGSWKFVQSASSQPYSIMHVRWQLHGSVFYPFFFRNDMGSIYYPDGMESNDGLEGWYWKPEVDAAIKALNEGKLKGRIEILGSWEFHPCNDTKPFSFVRDIYNLRAQWQSEGNPAHRTLKLVINLIYGKLAQSLGWYLDSKGYVSAPAYHNIGYAGYITACTRAKIFDAIMQAPDQIVAILSDGLFSLTKLDLPVGNDMGQWRETEFDGVVMVNQGVFWGLFRMEHEPTEQEKQDEFFNAYHLYHDGQWYEAYPHYQGYDHGKLEPGAIIDRWDRKQVGSMYVRSTRFVTIASALFDEEMLKCIGCWREIERELWPYPQGKRSMATLSAREANPSKHLEDTVASRVVIMSSNMSEKYNRDWESKEDDSGYVDGVPRKIYDFECEESNL